MTIIGSCSRISLMSHQEHFDHLVHGLSDDERTELLKKLKNIVFETPDFIPSNASDVSESEAVRYNLGFFERIILFFRAVFAGKTLQIMQEEHFLDRLSRKLDKNCAQYFSMENGEFYPEFGEEILRITRDAIILRDNIHKALGDRTGFVAFLSGLVVPELQSRLLRETDPYRLEETMKTKESIEIRRAVEQNREAAFADFSSKDKNEMYEVVKGFYSLASFLSYPFEQLSKIMQNSLGVPRIVSALEITKHLESFSERLFSFILLPEKIVLEAVYLYSRQEKSQDEQDVLAVEIKEFAAVYKNMISEIQGFNQKISLDKILIVLTKNLDYTVNTIHFGGEEWLSLLRRFWEMKNSEQINRYAKERKREELMELAAGFLDEEEYPLFPNYHQGRFGPEISVNRDFSASFIVNFIKKNFLTRMNPFFKLIQNDGDFYKEQNKDEYNEAYTSMFTLQKRIQESDFALSPEGAYGRRIAEIQDTLTGTAVIKEMQKTVESVESELSKHIMDFNIQIDQLINLLWGILFGEVGGRYDSLANISYLGGENNNRVITSLNNIYTEMKKFVEILHKIEDLEK